MYFETIAHMRRMLINLDGLMNKAQSFAETRKFDVNVLCESRLAPDMFPFVRQVQSCCDSAKFAAAYLSEKTAPAHEDNEKTWTELHERIKKVVNYLEGFKATDFKNAANVKVAPKWAKGAWLPADEYVQQVAIPNFYFHVTTAYAILRNSGVDIGKMDYLGTVNMRN